MFPDKYKRFTVKHQTTDQTSAVSTYIANGDVLLVGLTHRITEETMTD